MSAFEGLPSGLGEAVYGSFREELRAMPAMHRAVVCVGLVLMLCLFLESILILPLILIKWGWGYTVG
jgi:hypothetical protein